MSSMNFTCDSCGREVLGCTFVNGMKFCAKCYQETFGETDKDRKIAGLEAKLAEKEKEIAKQQLKQAQNKKAIEELEGLQVQCQFSITFADYKQEQRLYDYINDRIKELKGEKE